MEIRAPHPMKTCQIYKSNCARDMMSHVRLIRVKRKLGTFWIVQIGIRGSGDRWDPWVTTFERLFSKNDRPGAEAYARIYLATEPDRTNMETSVTEQ